MERRALYFPHIAPPEDAWFTRVLLYWDEVGTIVPTSVHGDPRYVTPAMKALLDAKLLRSVPPDPTMPLDEFARGFLALLERNPPARRPLTPATVAHVHVEKLGEELVRRLQELGYARAGHREGRGMWFDVEKQVATDFMAYLALALTAHDATTDPVTNREESLAALLGTDVGGAGAGARRVGAITEAVLREVLPAPSETIPPHELVDFKHRYGDQLRNFRREVEGRALEIARIDDPGLRARQAVRDTEDLVEQRDELAARMTERRWPKIVFGTILGLVAAAAPVAVSGVAGDVAGLAAGTPGLANEAYRAWSERTRSTWTDAPLAYAALAGRELAAAGA
jgi:hypothetical protein